MRTWCEAVLIKINLIHECMYFEYSEIPHCIDSALNIIILKILKLYRTTTI